jgi:hypothetical protein
MPSLHLCGREESWRGWRGYGHDSSAGAIEPARSARFARVAAFKVIAMIWSASSFIGVDRLGSILDTSASMGSLHGCLKISIRQRVQ